MLDFQKKNSSLTLHTIVHVSSTWCFAYLHILQENNSPLLIILYVLRIININLTDKTHQRQVKHFVGNLMILLMTVWTFLTFVLEVLKCQLYNEMNLPEISQRVVCISKIKFWKKYINRTSVIMCCFNHKCWYTYLVNVNHLWNLTLCQFWIHLHWTGVDYYKYQLIYVTLYMHNRGQRWITYGRG